MDLKEFMKTPEVKAFLDENTALRLKYKVGEDIIEKTNIPVIIMQSSAPAIVVFEKNYYTIVPYKSLIELVFPTTEKVLKATMLMSELSDNQLESLARKSSSSEHQYG